MPLPKPLPGTSAAALLLVAMTAMMPMSANSQDRKLGVEQKKPTFTVEDKASEAKPENGPVKKFVVPEDKTEDDGAGEAPVDAGNDQPPPDNGKTKAEDSGSDQPPPAAEADEPPAAEEEPEQPPAKAAEPARPAAGEEEEVADIEIFKPTDDVETKAQSVLDKACARCHQLGKLSPGKKKPAKGFGYVLQLNELASNPSYVVKGNPEGSKIFKMIVNKEMPYDSYQEGDVTAYSPSPKDIEDLRNWVTRLGETEQAQCTTEEIYSPKKLVDLMYADLSQLPDHERANTRYVSIAHLATACESEENLEVYRQGVVKLLNSLSSNSDVLEMYTIDKEKLIVRFNLDDLNWSPEIWEHIVKLYPYAVKPVNSQYDFLSQTTHSYVPYVRGDWLAFFASRPPLYEKILGLSDNFEGLQKQVGVDTIHNIDSYKVMRAGFKHSGVSQNNRLIERHAISTGAFWTSYDFGGTRERQNLMEYPLGPAGAFGKNSYGQELAFAHDGGESIFNLPNGFQAYYLNNAKGEHLDKGPTNIVRDPDRRDLAVTNGISCMGCHDQGMKNATDEVLKHATGNRILSSEVREVVKSIYPEKKEMDRVIEKDRKRFIDAMHSAGLDPKLKYGKQVEMVNALSNRYERDVDLASAAAEFGASPDDVKRYLASASEVGASFSSQLEQGTVQRDIFEENYGKLVEKVIDAEAIAMDRNAPGYAEIKKKDVPEYHAEKQANYEEPKKDEYVEPKKDDYVEPKKDDYVEPKKEEYVEPKKEKYVEPKKEEYVEPVYEEPKYDPANYDGHAPLKITFYPNSTHAYVGDKPQFTVRTDYDCYLTLINIDKHGESVVIYPNKFEQDNLIKGGRDFHYPAADAQYDFKYLDKGTETVTAICDVSGKATAGIEHNYNAEDFTNLGKGEAATRKIDIVKRDRPAKKKKDGGPNYSGVARASVKIKVQ